MDEIIPFEEHADDLRRARPMPPNISPLASVDRRARIGNNVRIGPVCVISPESVLGDGTILQNNVTLSGRVTLGCDNQVFPGVVIGGEPQDIPNQNQAGLPNVVKRAAKFQRPAFPGGDHRQLAA